MNTKEIYLNTEKKIISVENSTEIRKYRLIGQLVATCLVAGFFSYFKFKSSILQELTFIALGFPAFLYMYYGFSNTRVAHRSFAFSLFYLIPTLLSFAVNYMQTGTASLSKIIIIMNLFYAFYVASILANGKGGDLFPFILKYVFIFSIPIFIYVYVTQRHAYVWGRWEPFDIQPNWWGMMALGVAWGISALNSIKFRAIFFTTVFLLMVEFQSRGSIVALIPIVFLSYGFFIPFTKGKALILTLLLFIIIVVGVFSELLLDKGIFTSIIDYINNQVLLLNDPLRGVGSKLTGRMEGYLIAWEDFLDSPFLGKGFGEYEFVHNGILLTMAESGVLGLTGMTIVLGRSFVGLLKYKNYILLGLFLSYIVALLTFPRSFNINITGFLFIILIMRGSYTNKSQSNG